MPEELPIGSNVLTIVAQDPSTSSPVTKFNVKLIPRQLAMDPVGNVVVTERIDYESIFKKVKTNRIFIQTIRRTYMCIRLLYSYFCFLL